MRLCHEATVGTRQLMPRPCATGKKVLRCHPSIATGPTLPVADGSAGNRAGRTLRQVCTERQHPTQLKEYGAPYAEPDPTSKEYRHASRTEWILR